MVTKLKNSAGNYVTIQAGESCNLTGTLKDTGASTVTSPLTFTLTLYDEKTGAIINSRNGQDVLNTNGGAVTSGAYTVELDSSDTAAVGDIEDGGTQNRIARLEFTYNDGDSDRKGIEEFLFTVEKMKTAVGVGSGANEVTLTVTDASTNPVAEARVWVTSDKAGQTIVGGPVITGDDGITPTLNLDSGTYYSWTEHDDFSFTNPHTLTVS
jgi:poly-gamma-glutamate capsule biosynthesis protein CapA/YwtB (metallophosphatase superfamily)